ncbi:MAG: Coenzyme F420 hydrogenase/dehydrogenase, beta subunit C-terminal domain [Actinomycetes bacterium]
MLDTDLDEIGWLGMGNGTIDSLAAVVRGGLCTGCGICESLAGRDRVEMCLSAGGQLRPLIRGTLGNEETERLLAVCPGVTADGTAAGRSEPGTTLDPIWGPMRGLSRGWATDPEVRHRAAAGGALTALGCFLLVSGRVDTILHVRASAENPMLTDAQVSTTSEDVISGAQSRYGPAAPLVHVKQLLDAGSRFAVIAKPCDIAAIRNLAHFDQRARTQIPYLLTLFCGGVPNLGTARRIARFHGLEPEEVSTFRWRGEGWPGPTHVGAADGRSFDMTYDQTWFDPEVPWRYDVQWRCKICPDAIGELADIACPDGWVLDPDGRALHEEVPGVNVVLERTSAGSELVAAAVAAGFLELAPLTRGDFEGMHRDHRQRRQGEPARLRALESEGAAQPVVTGYRLDEAELEADPALVESQFTGAVRRIRAGQASEPLVDPDPPSDDASPDSSDISR